MGRLSRLARRLATIWPEQVYQVVRDGEKKIQFGFMGALALLVVLAVLSYVAAHKLRLAEQRETQLSMALAKLETLASLLNDADDAQRHYVITGEERYLAPYELENQRIDQDLGDLAALTAEYPDQVKQIGRLRPLIAAQFAEFGKTIELRRSQGYDAAMERLLEQEDQSSMDDIEQMIDDLRNEQEQWLIWRANESNDRERDLVLSIGLGSLTAIALVAFAAVLIDRDIRARKLADKNLRKSRDQLAIILRGVADGITVRDAANQQIYANEAAARAFGYATVEDFLDTPPSESLQRLEILDEFDRPLALAQLPEQQALRGEQTREAILRFRAVETGEERWMIAKATPAFDESGSVHYAISIFHDITERVQAYRTLELRVEERTREIERRRQVAEGLRDILTILNSNRPLDETLFSIGRQAGHLLGTEAGTVYRLEDQTQQLSAQVAWGPHASDLVSSVPAGWGPLGLVVRARLPAVVADMGSAQYDVAGSALAPEARAELERLCRHYSSWLVVPLMVKDEVYGAVALYYKGPREFSREEIEMAATFSDQAALAIENARLRFQAEQLAVAAERSRLARDLHDSVTQTLFSIGMIADVLPRLWERNVEDARRRHEELRELTHAALAEMRTLLLELRPARLTEIGLGELLRLLSAAIAGRARLPIDLSVESEYDLPPDVQIALYRIAQEALNNIVRHANASHIGVRLRCGDDRIELRIDDDGQGFEPSRVGRDRLGLAIMRERAEAVGAELWIESQLGGGTQIVVGWSPMQPVALAQPSGTYHLVNNL